MSARAKFRLLIVVLLAVVCLGFIAAIGMSAAATAATQEDPGHDHNRTDYNRTDYERPDRADERPTDERGAPDMRVNVHATEDGIAVTVDGDSPVDIDVGASDGDYAGEGQYRLSPGETLELPAPDAPTTVRVLAESDDARLEVRVGFDRYEYDCGPASHEQVAPAEVSYEWEAGNEERRRSQGFERPPLECPDPGDRPGGGDESPEDRYEETRETFWDNYEDGNDAAWTVYEALRAAAWGGYEDGRATVWETYEELRNPDDGGDDPQDRANETVDFAERVGNDTQDDADRVRNDAEDAVDRVGNDTQDDADRIREDAEEDRERLEEEANRTLGDLPPEEDDNGSDDGDRPSVPGPDGADVDADAGVQRGEGSVGAHASATVEAGGMTAHVHERLTAGLDGGP